MTSTRPTSTGHNLSEASWLDTHFQSAQSEYEDGLRFVGLRPGWKVLDAGCGGGGFLPLMSELVGPNGAITALDLAPENVARVDDLVRDGQLPTNIKAQLGSMLSLPFPDASFDCVWSANVVQYLTEAEFDQAVGEFKRVLKPDGTLAIKDFDAGLTDFLPMDSGIFARWLAGRRAGIEKAGILGIWCGPSLPSRLRRAGLNDIRRKGWLVERWAPLSAATRSFLETFLTYIAKIAETYDIPPSDLQFWRELAAHPSRLLDHPDLCFREGFVVAVGSKT